MLWGCGGVSGEFRCGVVCGLRAWWGVCHWRSDGVVYRLVEGWGRGSLCWGLCGGLCCLDIWKVCGCG